MSVQRASRRSQENTLHSELPRFVIVGGFLTTFSFGGARRNQGTFYDTHLTIL